MARRVTKTNVTKWLKEHGLKMSDWLPSSRVRGWGTHTSGFRYGREMSPLHLVVKYQMEHSDRERIKERLRAAMSVLSDVYDVEFNEGGDGIIVRERAENGERVLARVTRNNIRAALEPDFHETEWVRSTRKGGTGMQYPGFSIILGEEDPAKVHYVGESAEQRIMEMAEILSEFYDTRVDEDEGQWFVEVRERTVEV